MRKLHTLLALFALILAMGSCKKDDPVYPFKVVVESESGVRVQNAEVRCFVPLPNVDIEYYGTTGINGVASFEHDGGEIVVQIQVTKGNSTPTAVGCGYLKLTPDETATATIVVTEYDPEDPGCQ
ncbi:MAG: hypothetical protein EP346_02220 [Bacteroidetes bacterium]|uniref:Uncharacterized protein n=1 Tax=Phaeocystidibacter marisrubri TaxID=1577780 RepID=A0A6L3ZF81_9FLAO|nr:hypothetical protein [Phaeocystidibacter marisrubri]KAB2816511.1 hypothetical protein F8C82_12585 [Phaeocystidibacter marisrubri]TNE31014.1 MAG: hypothetical protein EP346_02220 [Bacteroidota bacterium]GGH69429.1 hypothetical protein GCM10011318_10430 [Phaeocystidibacter marisrubri]